MATGTSATMARLDNPIQSLTGAFWLWKALLFIAITACPGPGYDTSTTLIPYEGADVTLSLPWPLRLVRWDSIYFLHIAEQGYVFEQEWAFGYPRVLGFFVSGLRKSGGLGGPVPIALIAVLLSHVAHYFSVLALYRLSANIFGEKTVTQRLICFLSAALHIICPAGAFLSAPYGESIFSFLNFSGFYLYSGSLISERHGVTVLRDLQVLTAGVLFAIATMVRSNGILSGFLFAYDAFLLTWAGLTQGLSAHKLRRLIVVGVGGGTVALGMIVPQLLAYRTYCMTDLDREWCSWTLPSIYTWVQSYYWNVGFLRYWTVSNIPLFLLAAPILFIMGRSSAWALRAPSTLRSRSGNQASSPLSPGSMLFRLAVPQGLLAIMAITSYHVQIVNRVSSGYPVWYWYLVSIGMECLQDSRKNHRSLALAAQAMVLYALIQGVLFGSFLPPA
ncbi:GPI mannosyltransferase 2 [Penicillium sp. IBT 35674x]|nr:GPI mannosyltransferase 2 [Penicillium sp. IBT 35674x]